MCLIRKLKTYTKIEWLVFGIIISWNSWWPIWIYSLGAPLCYGFLMLLCIQLYHEHRLVIRNVGISFSLLCYFFLFQIFNVIHLSSLLIVFAFALSSCLTKEEGKNVIYLLTSYLALSIFISLPPWLVHHFVVQFQPFQVVDISSWKGNDGQYYLNFLLFITIEGLEAHRFYSLFDEPGVLGTFSAFVLWANKYNFKDKRCLVILIGALFTYSMAFYLLFIFGWLAKSGFKISKLFFTLVGLCVIGLISFFLLKDDLAFQQAIINRFLNFEENGVDTRTNYEMNQLWDKIIYTTDIIWGLGSGTTAKFGGFTSYRVFIIEYGFIGLFLVLIAYYKNILKKNYLTIVTLLLFFLSFLQRPALFTAQNILLFTCIVRNFENQLKIKYSTL